MPESLALDKLHILAWIGPSKEQITAKTMADLAAAGFDLTFSDLTADRAEQQLDLALAAGVRVVAGLPGLDARNHDVTAAWKKKARGYLRRLQGHPGLYGWFVADEPRGDRLPHVAAAMRFLADEDPAHLPYCNHWMVNMGFAGFRSYEEQWNWYLEHARPAFVSVDGYPFSVVPEDEWLAERAKANPLYYPRHRAKIHAHFYEMLDLLRQYSRIGRVPAWNCVFAAGAYLNTPEVFAGELRFQVGVSLAYGILGIQYFSYAHGGMLMGADLKPTANWQVARQVNRELRVWQPTLDKLTSIGVYHYPHNLPYTRPLDMFFLGHKNDLFARGDACVVGQFTDAEGWEYALIVNRTPYEPALVTFHFGTDDEVLELSPGSGEWARPWPYDPRKMPLSFQPGQARLFRYRRDPRA